MKENIEFHVAKETLKIQQEQSQEAKDKALNEFLTSDLEILDNRDIQYYSEVTGIAEENLLAMYSDMICATALTDKEAEKMEIDAAEKEDKELDEYLQSLSTVDSIKYPDGQEGNLQVKLKLL